MAQDQDMTDVAKPTETKDKLEKPAKEAVREPVPKLSPDEHLATGMSCIIRLPHFAFHSRFD